MYPRGSNNIVTAKPKPPLVKAAQSAAQTTQAATKK